MSYETETSLEQHMVSIIRRITNYLNSHRLLIWILILFVSYVYGYELFNVHITIDEEISAFRSETNLAFLTSGRWGLFLFANLFFQKSVIPFLPLATTLLFILIGILLLLETVSLPNKLACFLITAMGLAWSGFVYVFSFSVINFAIGFGFLCISLSLYLLTKGNGAGKLWAAIPIAFVISIYQPLLQPLVMVFLLYPLYHWREERHNFLRFLLNALLALGIGFVLYYGIQQLFLFAFNTSTSTYVTHYFDFANLFANIGWYLQKLARLFYNVMVGDSSFYSITVRALPIFLFVAGLIILIGEFKKRERTSYYLLFLVLLAIFTIMPFIGGILTKGYIPYRSLLGVPMFLVGWAALAFKNAGQRSRWLLSILAALTLFQFASSTNHLFASSAFAYEEDKILATQLIQRIEDEIENTGVVSPLYLEMVGYVQRPSTPLVSRIENIGASFFGWDGGRTNRVTNFLRILGYTSVDALPLERRSAYVDQGITMPVWPAKGSVQVVGDVVLVKFSPYSRQQVEAICAEADPNALPMGFCPQP